MGTLLSHGSTHATHFQHPSSTTEEIPVDEEDEHSHISISTKMVERLVEDARLASSAAAAGDGPLPPGDTKDQIYMEKLKAIDEKHSQRCGLTIEDVNAMATRIEMRTANMTNMDPVCDNYHQKVLNCYADHADNDQLFKCWESVGEFSRCVQDAAVSRLRLRTEREAREKARRSRHVAHAREHALRDLGPALSGEDIP